ncbi:hypothetical protein ACTQ6A_00290 [Lachnospiraceae bacterium LCP25S3_G4]
MYIDTHTRISMEKSICEYFNITIDELNGLFDKAGKASQTDTFFNGYKFDEIVNTFIASKMPKQKTIDQILFFHLGRRLNSQQECNVGNNLWDLLSTENALAIFLKEHDVEFLPCDEHLSLIYKGQEVSLEDTMQQHIPYLRWRLGFNKGRIDYCFNGFMLKDLLYKNNYARELYDVPEFIGVLATFLKRRDIGTDYFENGKYYCYEYCVPLEKVLFDDNESMLSIDKPQYVINQVLHRLYDYSVSDIRYLSDHENPIIRLRDDDTMQEENFVCKEEVTWEMLR